MGQGTYPRLKDPFQSSLCIPDMSWSLLLGTVIVFQGYRTDGCLPRRTKELTDSFVPVGIQALNHYKAQLEMYYPYTFTAMCETGKREVAIPQFPPREDVCVAESVARINLLLIDLQREAANRNLEDSEGLSRSVLTEIQRTSRMPAAQQFYYILEKLEEEGLQSGDVRCKMAAFQQDLENPDSRLFRNFLNVKPLNYLD